MESRDEKQRLIGMGVGASAVLTGLVVVEVSPFLSQRRMHCEGQWFVEREARL